MNMQEQAYDLAQGAMVECVAREMWDALERNSQEFNLETSGKMWDDTPWDDRALTKRVVGVLLDSGVILPGPAAKGEQ